MASKLVLAFTDSHLLSAKPSATLEQDETPGASYSLLGTGEGKSSCICSTDLWHTKKIKVQLFHMFTARCSLYFCDTKKIIYILKNTPKSFRF